MIQQKTKRLLSVLRSTLATNRLAAVTLACIACLAIGGGVYAYVHQTKKVTAETTQQPARSSNNPPKVNKKQAAPSNADTPPADTATTPATQPVKRPVPTKPKQTRRRADSTNPAWVACVETQSRQYIVYNTENQHINNEKTVALAELDRMYAAGEFAYDEEATYYDEHDQYNIWQIARAITSDEYNMQLQDLSSRYNTQSTAQQAACEATYDHESAQ